jgi:hypothetical protein
MYLQKVKSKKALKKILFVGILLATDKKAKSGFGVESGSGSGSVRQWYASADPY